MDIRGKRALVMGLGVHGGGLGVARFLAQRGADVTVTDLRDAAALQPTLDALSDLPIRYVLGQHREEDFRNTDLLIRNPGVPRESRFVQIARAAGAQIDMEMTLFFRLCPGPILGITGTKGKTTTTLLVGAMLREQFPDTVVAGNLRVSALEQLPKIGPRTPVVLELSSWQLEGLGEAKLSPPYACYLNLLPDHLDRYGSIETYADAKEQIFLHQRENDVVVFSSSYAAYSDVYAEDERGWRFWDTPARKIWYLAPNTLEADQDDDLQPGQHFTERDAFVNWLDTHLVWRQCLGEDAEGADWNEETICALEDVQLAGDHNLANVAAAAALAKAFGVTNDNIRNAVRAFTGVPDRLEFVREVGGARYINDTTATAPDAAIAALHSFDAPIVLIAGGADKNLTFERLAEAIATRAKAVVLLSGSATPKLQAELSSIEGPFDNFEDAVRRASELAEPGDVVLLSPGCASFGMFRNEFHRGDEFRRIVGAL